MRNYLKDLQTRMREIQREGENVYIVNAGIMNHGKSSLLNSLLDREVFAVQDVRTTREAKETEWIPNVYLVDTPGLQAEESDDSEAYAAYRRANLILFVHTAKVGELHREELSGINQMKKLAPSENYFWKHFCLVFTFKEADEESNLQAICEKSLQDIESACGGRGIDVFFVSNLRYAKGRREGKDVLVQHSGIQELRNYLMQNVSLWKDENAQLSRSKYERDRQETLEKLTEEKKKIKKALERKKTSIQKKHNQLYHQVEDIYDMVNRRQAEFSNAQGRVRNLEQELQSMEEEHRRDKNRY